MPLVQRLSFKAMGTPARGPGSSPVATRSSTEAAAARASSFSTCTKAAISASRVAISLRRASTAETAEISSDRIAVASSMADLFKAFMFALARAAPGTDCLEQQGRQLALHLCYYLPISHHL